MQQPDIFLGPGDTAPVFDVELRNPNLEDGSQGPVIDGTGGSAVFKIQRTDQTLAAETVSVPFISPASAGKVRLDFRVMLVTLAPGVDYNFRIIVTTQSGHQVTVPSGPDLSQGGGNTSTFYLLRVAPDFVAVGP